MTRAYGRKGSHIHSNLSVSNLQMVGVTREARANHERRNRFGRLLKVVYSRKFVPPCLCAC